MRSTALTLFLSTTIATPLVAQASIQSMIDAAPPGATVTVPAGQFFEALTIDKSLHLIGAGSALTKIEALPGSPVATSSPAIHVDGLTATESVKISGFELSGWGQTFGLSGVMLVTNCVGPVTLTDIDVTTEQSQPLDAGMMVVLNCAEVLLTASHIDFGVSPTGVGRAQSALQVENSNVYVSDSDLIGRSGGFAFVNANIDGGVAIDIDSSIVRVSNCRLVGGDGGTTLGAFQPASGGPAIRAFAANVFLHGGPSNTLTGGDGASDLGGFGVEGQGASAIELAQSLIEVPSDVFVVPGLDGDGATTAPPTIADPVSTVVNTAHRHVLQTDVPRVSLGGTFELQAFDLAFVASAPFLALDLAPQQSFPTVYGEFLFGASFAPLPVFFSTLPLTMPIVPALVGELLYFQSLGIGVDIGISLPTAILIAN